MAKEKMIIILLIFVMVAALIPSQISSAANDVYDTFNDDEESLELNIPTSLTECFKQLDLLLLPEDIETIKNSELDDLGLYHFGLGLWIRNNWIYPNDSELGKVFISAGFRHPDYMSQYIIEGYYNYLNNGRSAQLLENEFYRLKTYFLLQRLFLMILLIAIIVAIRFLLRKLPAPVRMLEKIKFFMILRVTFVICISSILLYGVNMFISSNFWSNVGLYNWPILPDLLYVCLLVLVFTGPALFLFVDMTRKQIAISAIPPTVYFISCAIYSYIDPYSRIYNVLNWEGWRFIYNASFISVFATLTGTGWVGLYIIVFAFFPFIYVILSRSKNEKVCKHGHLHRAIEDGGQDA